jgi:hypothetical protein
VLRELGETRKESEDSSQNLSTSQQESENSDKHPWTVVVPPVDMNKGKGKAPVKSSTFLEARD